MTHCTLTHTGGAGSFDPDWATAHRAWLDANESLAIAVLKTSEPQESRRND